MPVSSTDISSSIQSAASFAPGGPVWGMFCDALGEAIASWIVVPANVRLVGVTTGTVGAGLVRGNLRVPANATTIIQALHGGGISGTTTDRVAQAIANGIAASLTRSAIYVGPSVGVAAGVDVSQVTIANSVTLSTILTTVFVGKCASRNGFGPYTPNFLYLLSAGIAFMVLLGGTQPGTGIVTPSGPTSYVTGTGTSPSSSIL